MTTQIVNLTPHTVTIVLDNGIRKVFKPSGIVARRETSTEVVGDINGIPVTRTVLGPITGLPDESDDTVYIVSRIIAEKAGRNDLLIPDQTVRDENGVIIGCKSLGRI